MTSRPPRREVFDMACRAFETEMWPDGPAHGSGSGVWARHKPRIAALLDLDQPQRRDIESEIEQLTTAIDQHHFGAGANDRPFCSCGWTGEPSDNWLTAERQYGRHLATSLVVRGGRFGGNWDDGVRRAEPVIPGATVDRFLPGPGHKHIHAIDHMSMEDD